MVKNPLLQGCALGILFFLTGLHLPSFLAKPIAALGNSATPLALITLGGTMEFAAFRKNIKAVSAVLALKLVVLPVIFTLIAYAIGLRGVELFLTLMIFATPVAVSSYPMAVNMGGDGQLAGQLVFASTIASLLTIFGFIFTMSRMGLLV
jgi:predicted permease